MDWKSKLSLNFGIKYFSSCSLSIYFLCFFCFFFFFSFCTLFSAMSLTTTCPDSRCPFSSEAVLHIFQTYDKRRNNMEEINQADFNLGRRLLSGLGSSPPRCTSKCGRCTPCKPVHVPVPPGTPVTAEYYPEAWRCKCGNKLYMP